MKRMLLFKKLSDICTILLNAEKSQIGTFLKNTITTTEIYCIFFLAAVAALWQKKQPSQILLTTSSFKDLSWRY